MLPVPRPELSGAVLVGLVLLAACSASTRSARFASEFLSAEQLLTRLEFRGGEDWQGTLEATRRQAERDGLGLDAFVHTREGFHTLTVLTWLKAEAGFEGAATQLVWGKVSSKGSAVATEDQLTEFFNRVEEKLTCYDGPVGEELFGVLAVRWIKGHQRTCTGEWLSEPLQNAVGTSRSACQFQ